MPRVIPCCLSDSCSGLPRASDWMGPHMGAEPMPEPHHQIFIARSTRRGGDARDEEGAPVMVLWGRLSPCELEGARQKRNKLG